MAIQNKTVTLLGANAKLVSFTVYPQASGAYSVVINGVVDDGAGFTDQLSASVNFPSGVAVLDNMSARALTELRKANGLET